MTKKATFYTRLEAVCSGDAPDELFMVGIRHQMSDPIADQVLFVLDVRANSSGQGALWGGSGSWLTRFDGKTWATQ